MLGGTTKPAGRAEGGGPTAAERLEQMAQWKVSGDRVGFLLDARLWLDLGPGAPVT